MQGWLLDALTSLDLVGSWRIKDAGLASLVVGCPVTMATSLDLVGCNRITDTGLTSLAAGCPALIRVVIRVLGGAVCLSILQLMGDDYQLHDDSPEGERPL